jgi:hypothetical protein
MIYNPSNAAGNIAVEEGRGWREEGVCLVDEERTLLS